MPFEASDELESGSPGKPGPTVRKSGKYWLAATIGFGIGILVGSTYLLAGGEYVFNVPRWASLLFFTGFTVGNKAYYELGMPELAAKMIGVAAVGLTYALIAVLVCLPWIVRRNQSLTEKS